MGWERIALASMALTWFQFCDASEPPPSEAELPPMQAEVELGAAALPAPEPLAGGTVVVAGPHPMEVAPYEDGTVIAYVRSASPPPPASTQVTVRVPADDGATHPVLLVWDPAAGHYRGRVRGVHPVPGPVDVTVIAAGTRHVGSQPRVVVVGPAPPVVEVEVPEVDVEGAEPRPGVEVEVPAPPPEPSVRVEVQAPQPPRANVVVRPSGARSARVSRRGRARARRRRRGRRSRFRIRH